MRNVPAIAMVFRFVGEVKRANGYPPKKPVPDTRPPFEYILFDSYLAAQPLMSTFPRQFLAFH